MTARSSSSSQPLAIRELSQDRMLAMLTAPEDSYSVDAATFRKYLEDRGEGVTIEGLAGYVAHMQAQGYAAATQQKRWHAARNRIMGAFDRSPDALDGVKRSRLLLELKALARTVPKTQRHAVEHTLLPTEADIDRLAGAASERMACWIAILYGHGVRVSEACGIVDDADNVKDRGDGYYSVRIMGKGKKERTLKVEAWLIEHIRSVFHGERWLFETAGGKPYRRQYVSYQLHKLSERVLGRSIGGAHAYRHAFATRHIEKNPDQNMVKAISKYMGHSSTSITMDMYVSQEMPAEDLVLTTGLRQAMVRRQQEAVA